MDNYPEEETVYGESGREEMVDNDEISPEEEGFMKGYDDSDDDEEKEDDEEKDEEELY